MTSRDFCYWLQGYLEISGQNASGAAVTLTQPQVECVKKHLNMVFVHEIDPSFGDEKEQAKLDAIHQTTAPKPPAPPIGGHLPGRPDVLIRC